MEYKRSVHAKDWGAAEHCLATRLRMIIREPISDRTWFDQYLAPGLKTNSGELVKVRDIDEELMTRMGDSLEMDSNSKPEGFTFEVQIGGYNGPPAPSIVTAHFIREEDGWKLACPRIKKQEDFQVWYERAIPKEVRGQARKEEAKRAEQTSRADSPTRADAGLEPPQK